MNNFNRIILPVVALLFFSSIAQAASLSDISANRYRDAIQSLTDLGVINGYDDGTYKPDRQINRAEFLKITMGASSDNIGTGADCFLDVKSEWFAPFICLAKNLGIIEGYSDGNFRPAQTVNYAEALKMLYLANEDNGVSPTGKEWYSRYYEDALKNGIALNEIGPLGHLMTRGEIAQLVWNYKQKKGSDSGSGSSGTDTPGTDSGSTSGTDTGETSANTPPPATPSGTSGTSVCNTAITGNALYVSTTGNDASGTGAETNPYRTIARALENSSAGDTIAINGGTYNETTDVRVRNPNITIRSVPGEWAIIDRSGEYGDDVIAVYFDVDSDGSKLQCVEVIGGFYAFATETRWDWGEADRSGASNIIIEDSKLHDSGRDVIKIKPNSDNITIRRNEIYNSGHGLSRENCNAEGIDNVNGDNLLVQDNYIHDICSNGVYCKGGAQNCVVEGNRIVNTGSAGILVGFDTSPEYFDLGVNPGYYENINGIVRNNLVIDAGGSGIGLFASKNALVYGNTIVNTASRYHSPIYFGITFQDWEDYAGRPANINPTVKDNVVVQYSGHDTSTIDIRYTDELGGLSALDGNPTMSGNCYYHEDGAASFNDRRPGSTLEDGTLAQWQAHIGSDTGSIEANPALDGLYKATGACAGKGYMP